MSRTASQGRQARPGRPDLAWPAQRDTPTAARGPEHEPDRLPDHAAWDTGAAAGR